MTFKRIAVFFLSSRACAPRCRLYFASTDHFCSFSLVCLCYFLFFVSEETTSKSLVDGVADRLTAMIPEKSLFIFNSLSHPCTPKILRRTDRLTMQ